MSRRGENIRKRKDGRWEARYPTEKINGKTKYRSVYAETYREVKEKRQLQLDAYTAAHCKNNSLLTFGEAFCHWESDNSVRLKKSTVYRYRYLADTHILPALGSIRLDELTSQTVNTYIADMMSVGRTDGKGALSPSYIRSITLIISSVYSYAENALNCSLPKLHIVKPAVQNSEIQLLSRVQQEMLETELTKDIYGTKMGVLISLYTGMRLGEVCALKWEDIDLTDDLIYVRRTVTRIAKDTGGTEYVVDVPKTQNSKRCIPLCSVLKNVIINYSAASGYVISGTDSFINPRTFEYRYAKLLRTAGLPHIKFHALRHTFATRCIEAGMDVKSLSELMGHSDVSVTLKNYVHSSMEHKRQQLEKLIEL